MKKAKPIEVGTTVKWTRRNGLPAKGKVLLVDQTASGPWVVIVTASGESRVRPAVLRAK